MRLRNQFLITLLSASLALLVAMLLLVQFLFERSLEQYLDQRQRALLQGLSEEFSDYYAYYGSFDGITLRTMLWNMEAGEQRRIPPDLVLLDDQQQPIFGPPIPPTQLHLFPVRVDDAPVGWLGLPNSPEFREDRAQHFEQRQRRLLGTVALFALALATVGGIWISRRLVRPIEAVANLAEQLQQGNYQARLDTERKDELGSLINAMNSLSHTLASSQDSRQRWLADMAHELRTPMTVLRGEIEAVQDGVRAFNVDTVSRLHQEILHISHLLDDLHDLSLADVGALRYQMTPVDVGTLLQNSCNASQITQSLQLRCEIPEQPCVLLGDATRLRQLFDNLLSNAHKYTDAGGQVRVVLSASAEAVHIRIEDSAPGVSDEQLPHLFEYLYRTEQSRNRQTGGAGLGLAICERIVNAHQGSIGASHSALGGLRIDIVLGIQRP